ncbi:MAG: glycoside hydrolase family 2 protein [Chlorobi bacterium]|nr:glycoside hydrolase family 2 protein [Chlorobiota bacterium]
MKKLITGLLAFTAVVFYSCRQMSDDKLVTKSEINSRWQFSEAGKNDWKSAKVPGCVHTDLIEHKVIEDPFYRLNEHNVQWIDKKDWEYKTTFDVGNDILKKEHVILDFKGLDTYADVYLNEKLILNADNMFREWKVDCKEMLNKGENELRIYFHSPIKIGLEIYDNYPYVVQSSPNDLAKIGKVPGDKWISPHIRKAPYQFGWDWGPRLVTSGIWKPVILEAWSSARIEDVHTRQKILTEKQADLVSELTIESSGEQKAKVKILIDGNTVKEEKVSLSEGRNYVTVDYSIDNPELWWPNELGEQKLYNVTAEVETEKGADSFEHTLGLRTVELIRDSDDIGVSFYFKVNGHPVFMKGANVIPNDVFLNRVTPEKYEHIISSAAKSNFNMLRVWGGGIYEKDIFYDLCDKYGILLWHDFMFACNMYPGDEKFLESVKHEAEDNVKRLRNHPSIAMWCGNNEILEAWFQWGWKEENEKKQPEGAKAMWKAYKDIFLNILRGTVKKYDPDRPYWASSPQSGDTVVSHIIDGDKHDWRVWFQKVPFTIYHDNPARFVSEYGFQSFPEMKTIKKYALPEDYDINSEVMKSHQRSFIGNRQIKYYMDQYFREPKDFESFIYTGLVLQGEGIKTGIEGHRFSMPRTMGSLYWQLNDVWPVASWSSIDYYGNWKAEQYMVRKAFEPVIVVPDIKDDEILMYVVSDRLEDFDAVLKMRIVDFVGNELKNNEVNITVEANSSNVVVKNNLKHLLKDIEPQRVVLDVALLQDGKEIYRTTKYFKRTKDLELPMPELKIETVKTFDGYQVTVSTDVLAKNVYLSFDDYNGWFTDNFFDLLPGESKTVEFVTKERIEKPADKLKVRSIRDTY